MTVAFDTEMLIGPGFVAGTETSETVLNPKTEATLVELPEASADQIGLSARLAEEPPDVGRE